MRSSSAFPECVEDVFRPDNHEEGKIADLEDSVLTEAGSLSEEEEGGGWLGGISADFRTLAISLRETAGGVASFVHRSAVAVAQEIAQLEKGERDDGMQNLSNSRSSGNLEILPFPWEILDNENMYTEDFELKSKIRDLSKRDETFFSPFTKATADDDSWTLDEPRIQLVRRILDVDEHLAATHARLSGRSDVREIVFWRNYFYHCDETRRAHMILCGSTDSLARTDSFSRPGDEASIIDLPSPPTSLNSVGYRSIDSLVFVDGNILESE